MAGVKEQRRVYRESALSTSIATGIPPLGGGLFRGGPISLHRCGSSRAACALASNITAEGRRIPETDTRGPGEAHSEVKIAREVGTRIVVAATERADKERHRMRGTSNRKTTTSWSGERADETLYSDCEISRTLAQFTASSLLSCSSGLPRAPRRGRPRGI